MRFKCLSFCLLTFLFTSCKPVSDNSAPLTETELRRLLQFAGREFDGSSEQDDAYERLRQEASHFYASSIPSSHAHRLAEIARQTGAVGIRDAALHWLRELYIEGFAENHTEIANQVFGLYLTTCLTLLDDPSDRMRFCAAFHLVRIRPSRIMPYRGQFPASVRRLRGNLELLRETLESPPNDDGEAESELEWTASLIGLLAALDPQCADLILPLQRMLALSRGQSQSKVSDHLLNALQVASGREPAEPDLMAIRRKGLEEWLATQRASAWTHDDRDFLGFNMAAVQTLRLLMVLMSDEVVFRDFVLEIWRDAPATFRNHLARAALHCPMFANSLVTTRLKEILNCDDLLKFLGE